MTIRISMAALAGLMLLGCGKEPVVSPPTGTNAAAPGGNPLTAPVEYLGAAAKAQKTAVTTVDTASLNKAIQLFYAQEDRYPKDLNELVSEKYLPAVPALPAGMKFEYDARTGSVRVVRQ